MKKMTNQKIPYEKPKVITCKDCLKYAECLEHSRLYLCREFQKIPKRGENIER